MRRYLATNKGDRYGEFKYSTDLIGEDVDALHEEFAPYRERFGIDIEQTRVVVVHPRLSVDQLCFLGATLDQFAEECRGLGAHHVVLTSPQLLVDGGADAARRALADGPQVEAVNHQFAVFPDLERDDGGAAAALTRLIPVATELGARSVYLVTGGRGRLSWENAADRFCELVATGAAATRERGIALMIENSTGLYADIHIAHTLGDTLTLAEHAVSACASTCSSVGRKPVWRTCSGGPSRGADSCR